MLLGKRSRPGPPIGRTTSMKELAVDLKDLEAPAPTEPQNPTNDGQKPVGLDGSARQDAGVGGSDGFDHRFLSTTVSPRNQRRNSPDYVETAHFLRACGLCNRRLAPGRDIYMYRGEVAFCSLECRQQQMNHDERKEKCSLASKIEAVSSTPGSEASSNGERVAAA
ncbi:hypothetical protein HHK36_004052 [Tetracentron sinense]|uniref:FLZ-type domain-containing protein n=1 Tax=Tetracentron sinense TaxID=13715 RepID=A0A834ZQ66_TETSI|nr:hypothetical protein HHK36_004052 [Tetracentron sinense]